MLHNNNYLIVSSSADRTKNHLSLIIIFKSNLRLKSLVRGFKALGYV